MGILVIDAVASINQRLGPCARLIDTSDCLLRSARYLPITTASLTVLADVDLVSIKATQLDQFYDIAEWEGLRRILRNLDKVDLAAYGIDEAPDKLFERLNRQFRDMTTWIERNYNIGTGTLEGGVFQYDFASHNDCDTSEW